MGIRVLIADDHKIVIEGLKRLLEQEGDITVVGETSNGLSAIDMTRQLQPDIVIMDIGMPDLNGIEATRQIMRECSATKVVGLSMHSSEKYVKEMIKAGAWGYLLKDCAGDELVVAIRNVAAGKKYLSPSVTNTVLDNYAEGDERSSAFSVLTQREREVLQLLAEGRTTKQIGRSLHISPKTVEAHRLRVMGKLNMNSVAKLTKYAVMEGLTPAEP
jgi:DNA-binding NarL/FixJ family response regulator